MQILFGHQPFAQGNHHGYESIGVFPGLLSQLLCQFIQRRGLAHARLTDQHSALQLVERFDGIAVFVVFRGRLLEVLGQALREVLK